MTGEQENEAYANKVKELHKLNKIELIQIITDLWSQLENHEATPSDYRDTTIPVNDVDSGK